MYKRLHVSGIAPAKRDVPVLLHVFAVEIISIHAPCGGGACDFCPRCGAPIFQFTPPCGGGRRRGDNPASVNPFQFTPPCGGGSYPLCPCSRSTPYFNSRPRVGAGLDRYNMLSNNLQFQFTPPCGGGSERCDCVSNLLVFQFTPPCGGGQSAILQARMASRISIHAPVWGRAAAGDHADRRAYFNSRPRVGAGGFTSIRSATTDQFQFTPPCGGEPPACAHAPAGLTHFNSRPRVGGGLLEAHSPVNHILFQFTPPRGGGRGQHRRYPRAHDFNSRPRVGAGRARKPEAAPPHGHFNSRPRVGRAGLVIHPATACNDFNSRPVWGRAGVSLHPTPQGGISIHAPVWGRGVLHRRMTRFLR